MDKQTEFLIRSGVAESKKVIEAFNLQAEPEQVAESVEKHRWAWKPQHVRVLLIAESHVFTSESDMAIHMSVPTWLPLPTNAPMEFVRLVYCLGYGESSLLSNKPAKANTGTPQYWKYFGRIANSGPYPRKWIVPDIERLYWKLQTLQELQRLGVWLLDASFSAIYATHQPRTRAEVNTRLHRVWWESYGKTLRQSCPDAKVFAIGKSVKINLERLGCDLQGWIYQPQAQRGGVDMEFGWSSLEAAIRSIAT